MRLNLASGALVVAVALLTASTTFAIPVNTLKFQRQDVDVNHWTELAEQPSVNTLIGCARSCRDVTCHGIIYDEEAATNCVIGTIDESPTAAGSTISVHVKV